MSFSLIAALALAAGPVSGGDAGPLCGHSGWSSGMVRLTPSIPPTISGSRGRYSRLSARTGP